MPGIVRQPRSRSSRTRSHSTDENAPTNCSGRVSAQARMRIVRPSFVFGLAPKTVDGLADRNPAGVAARQREIERARQKLGHPALRIAQTPIARDVGESATHSASAKPRLSPAAVIGWK